MEKKPYLSIIIPAFNEEKRIPSTLKEIDGYLREQSFSSVNCEIIVVNDGSTDKTAETCRNLTSTIQNLKIIDNKINQGKGAVVRQGMLAAKGKYRVFTDADNSTGFSARGAGTINGSSTFKETAHFWSSTSTGDPLAAYYLNLWYNSNLCGVSNTYKTARKSVRLVKDV